MTGTSKAAWPDVLFVVLAGGVFVLAGLRGLGPDGRVGGWWVARQAARADAVAAAAAWPELARQASPLGSEPPAVVIAIDYQCAYCRRFAWAEEAFRAHGMPVGILQAPAPGDSVSQELSSYALCAARIGRFADVHGRLLRDAGLEAFRRAGRLPAWEAALPEESRRRLGACRDAHGAAGVLAAHRRTAGAVGLRGTPMYILPGEIQRGVPAGDSLALARFIASAR